MLLIKKASKSVQILDLLEAAGDRGMSFTDIQAALWLMSYPDGKEEFDTAMSPCYGRSPQRRLRGYWCTNLLGGRYYHDGLLHTFADKGADGRWRRNAVRHHGQPWSLVKKPACHPYY